MPDLQIRPATTADLDAVLAINPDRREYVQRIVGNGSCLVAEADGGIAGFVIVEPKGFFERDFLVLLFVTTTGRRLGTGTALIRAALAGSTTARMFTSTNASNQPMRALLKREGWEQRGIIDGIDDADPEIVYSIDR